MESYFDLYLKIVSPLLTHYLFALNCGFQSNQYNMHTFEREDTTWIVVQDNFSRRVGAQRRRLCKQFLNLAHKPTFLVLSQTGMNCHFLCRNLRERVKEGKGITLAGSIYR